MRLIVAAAGAMARARVGDQADQTVRRHPQQVTDLEELGLLHGARQHQYEAGRLARELAVVAKGRNGWAYGHCSWRGDRVSGDRLTRPLRNPFDRRRQTLEFDGRSGCDKHDPVEVCRLGGKAKAACDRSQFVIGTVGSRAARKCADERRVELSGQRIAADDAWADRLDRTRERDAQHQSEETAEDRIRQARRGIRLLGRQRCAEDAGLRALRVCGE